MHTILIVGKSFHTLESYLKDHGDNFVKIPHGRPDVMLTAAKDLAAKQTIDGVMAIYEQYIQTAAIIAKHLGLPGLPLEAAQACTDKLIMRQKFAAAPEKISPEFALVNSKTDVHNFADAHNFPLILKPANLSKSLLVFKNHDLPELLANYKRMQASIEEVYAKFAPHTMPKVLIEEFMEGPVHSVDAFVDSQGTPHVLEQVVDYQTGYEIGYDDNFHYSRIVPSALPPDQIAKLRHTAEVGCRALGIKNSPAHVEIIRTKEGPRLVEIGARNGGYRSRMHSLANGIDITGNAIALALGQTPKIQATRNDHIGVLELLPKIPGVFAGIQNEQKLKALPSLTYYSLKATPGTYVGKSSDGYKMCAVIMLHNKDANQFERDLKFVNQHVRVMTTPAP